MTDQPEQTRHKDTERNLILNRALTDLEQIINCHDPEIDVPIKDGAWNRLDKMAQEIEAGSAVVVKPQEWDEATLSPQPPQVTPEQVDLGFASDAVEILQVAIDNWNILHPSEPDEIFTDLQNRARAIAGGDA